MRISNLTKKEVELMNNLGFNYADEFATSKKNMDSIVNYFNKFYKTNSKETIEKLNLKLGNCISECDTFMDIVLDLDCESEFYDNDKFMDKIATLSEKYYENENKNELEKEAKELLISNGWHLANGYGILIMD